MGWGLGRARSGEAVMEDDVDREDGIFRQLQPFFRFAGICAGISCRGDVSPLWRLRARGV